MTLHKNSLFKLTVTLLITKAITPMQIVNETSKHILKNSEAREAV